MNKKIPSSLSMSINPNSRGGNYLHCRHCIPSRHNKKVDRVRDKNNASDNEKCKWTLVLQIQIQKGMKVEEGAANAQGWDKQWALGLERLILRFGV